MCKNNALSLKPFHKTSKFMLACQKTRKVGGPPALNSSKIFWLLLTSLINIQQSDCEPNKYETFILKNSKNQKRYRKQ